MFRKNLILFSMMALGGQSALAEASKYLFLQQFSDMCIIAPMINLQRLESLRVKYPASDDSLDFKSIPMAEWLTRRQWFGEGFRYLYAWHKAFTWPAPWEVTSQGESIKAPSLHTYLTEAVHQGPVMPHFYNAAGQIPFGVTEALNFAFLPYFLVDLEAMGRDIKGANWLIKKLFSGMTPALGLSAPVVLDDDGQYYAYNQETKNFDQIEMREELPIIFQTKEYQYLEVPVGHLQTISGKPLAGSGFFEKQNPKNLVLSKSRSGKPEGLGFMTIAHDPSVARGFMMEKPGDSAGIQTFAPYGLGFYKLMLLRLGFDNHHNSIIETKSESSVSDLSSVHRDLVELVNASPDNPWNDQYFSADKFFPHHLAQLFKENPELFRKASAVVDFYKIQIWRQYCRFLDEVKEGKWFHDQNGLVPYQYDKVVKYLPGPEQMLAFAFLRAIRTLWYGAMGGETAFYAGTIQHIPFFWSFDDFLSGVYQKVDFNGQKISFISVWHEVLDTLNQNGLFAKRKDFVSFEGHGWVITFNPQLRYLDWENLVVQKVAKRDQRIKLLLDLRCTGIDSWHGQHIKSFYTKYKS